MSHGATSKEGPRRKSVVSWKRPEQWQGRLALRVASAHPEQLMEVPSCVGVYSGGCGAATELAGICSGKGMEFLVLRTQTLLATYT